MPPRFSPPPLQRMPPRMRPDELVSYSSRSPLRSHFRKASCEEYECEDFMNGFVLTVDTSTEIGQLQAYYVSHDKSRKFSMQHVHTTVYKFIYPPGTPGFAGDRHDHYLPLDRPPFYLVVGGDWRGNPRNFKYTHRRPEDWVDDFATNQDRISTILKRG